jgi:hypothetical protein
VVEDLPLFSEYVVDASNRVEQYSGPQHWLYKTDEASFQAYFDLRQGKTVQRQGHSSTIIWKDKYACIMSIIKVWNIRDADAKDWQVRPTCCLYTYSTLNILMQLLHLTTAAIHT